MSDLGHIVRCMDLREEDIAGAMTSREGTRALLAHLTACSAPNSGTAKVLLVLARMATTACEWLDGDLAIVLAVDGEATRIDVATELGGGLRERVFPPLALRVPLAEFARAIERVPHMIAPLAVGGRSKNRITLGATAAIRRTSIPPPPVEIDAESLYVRVVPAPPLPRQDEGVPPVPLPVVTSGLPIVGGALPPPPPASPPGPPDAPAAPSDPPVGDVDSGWDD